MSSPDVEACSTVSTLRRRSVTSRVRIVGACFGGVLFLVGCGGGDSDRIAELEAQIEELAAAQDSEPATPTPEPVEQEAASTVAPDSAVDEQVTPSIEPEGSSTTTTLPSNEILFAEPNGPTLQEATSVADLRAIAEIQEGPTDDLAGQVARFGPFPLIPTLENTDVSALLFDMQSTFRDDFQVNGFEQTVRIDATTTASREDVDVALQASIVAAGFDPDPGVESGRVWTRTFDGPEGWVRVNMTELGDSPGTLFEIDYVVFSEVPRTELLASSIGWAGNGPWGDGLLNEVQFEMNRILPSYKMSVHHKFPGQNNDDLEEGIAFRSANSDWPIVREFGGVIFISNGEVGETTIDGFALANTQGTSTTATQLFDYKGSR